MDLKCDLTSHVNISDTTEILITVIGQLKVIGNITDNNYTMRLI